VIQRRLITSSLRGREEVTGANVAAAIFAERERPPPRSAGAGLRVRRGSLYISPNRQRPGVSESAPVRGLLTKRRETKGNEDSKKKGEAARDLMRTSQEGSATGKDRSVIGSNSEINRANPGLCRRQREKPNRLFVGEAGVGTSRQLPKAGKRHRRQRSGGSTGNVSTVFARMGTLACGHAPIAAI